VAVLSGVMVTLAPQHESKAVGGSNAHWEPHTAVLLLPQVMTGGVVSCTVIVWLQAGLTF